MAAQMGGTMLGMAKLGFLGLGLMGYPMARNLPRAGHQLAAWSHTGAKAQQLASEEKAIACATPKQVAEQSDFVFACVGDTRMSEEVFTGPNGRNEVPVRVVTRYRSLAGVANAVAAGVGLAALPGIVFEDPAFKDMLVPVLPEYPLESPTLYVVYASRKYLPLKIRAFIDFVFESISRVPVPKPPLSAPLMSRSFLRRNGASIK